MSRISDFVQRRSRLIILAVILLNLLSLSSFARFQLDTNFLSFFSAGNPEAREFDHLKQKYSTGESFLVLLEAPESILSAEKLKTVLHIEQEISAAEGVQTVRSFLPPAVPVEGEWLPIDKALAGERNNEVAEFIEDRYFLTPRFLSPDGRTGIISVETTAGADADHVLDTLKGVQTSADALRISLAGDEVIKDTLWHSLLKVLFLLPGAIVLILFIFFLILRSVRLSLLAFLPAAFAALWTFGTIFWSGHDLDMVTVISPIFIMVIGCAFGLHLISHFLENRKLFPDRKGLIGRTLGMAGPPIAMAAVTTMAGFASLSWSELAPLRDLGIFVAVGVSYAGLISLVFVPAVLSRIRLLPGRKAHQGPEIISRVVSEASRRRVAIAMVFLGIVAFGAVYIPRIEVISDQLMFFKDDSSIKHTFRVIEENFGDPSQLTAEVVCSDPEKALADSSFAARILSLERDMEKLPGVASAFSIFDMWAGMKQIPGSTDPTAFASWGAMAPDTKMWISDDGVRLILRTRDLDRADMEAIEDFAQQSPEVRMVTGMPLVLSEMNSMVVRTQIQSLGLAFVLIFLLLLLSLRSAKDASLGLMPVGVTIMAILGMLAATGFELNVMTATLSAISVGAGVDYSVHVLSGIGYFRRQGMDDFGASRAAVKSVAMPVLGDALGITVGLSVLYLSPLKLHMEAASVMWVAMPVAAAAALLVIPLFYHRRGNR